jgi:2-keto-myo-inositol isomerase
MSPSSNSLSRRDLLATASFGVVSASSASLMAADSKTAQDASKPFQFCLNMSTIRGQKLTVVEQIDIAAAAGYDAIEPWMNELHQFVEQGGRAAELRQRISDKGLKVASAIGFAEWIVDDEAKRRQGLETAKRDMSLLRDIGGTRIAAPPSGATRQTDLNLFRAAERYHDLLEVGHQLGVTPQLELWGFSKSLSRLGEALFVATESGHPDACLLADVYHIYKGGSSFTGLQMINGLAMHAFHMNDYPADPKRDAIGDSHRVYPGDGVAPLNTILRDLYSAGFRGTLSLELFNPEYWKQDPALVARTGLDKMRTAVQKSLT